MITIIQVNNNQVDELIPLMRALAEFEKMDSDFHPVRKKLEWQLRRDSRHKLHTFIAYDGIKPIGFLMCYIGGYSSFKSRWSVCLEDVYVDETYRGQGLLHNLLFHVADLALDLGLTTISFSVLDWNEGAIAAYKKLGAVQTGKQIDFLDDGSERTWLTMVFQNDTLQALVDYVNK